MGTPYADYILDPSRMFRVEDDFETQADDLLDLVRLKRGDVENLKYLLMDLQFALKAKWPDCEIQPFGSIVTGLGLKTSNVDCFVSLPGNVLITHHIVSAAKDILDHHGMFSNIVAKPNANIPIVKLLYEPNTCLCDIYFHSQSGVHNSRLMFHLFNSDKKVLDVAVLVKYWSKVHKFTGTHLISNHALTLLVIFYMQQVGLLPSVHDLQAHVPSLFVDNWNMAFEDVGKPDNDVDLFDILGGFFKFYSKFNFSEHIVSPYLGEPVSKERFRGLNNLPDEYGVYKINVMHKGYVPIRMNTLMTIQDPFEHNKNCSADAPSQLVEKFLYYISHAAKKFDEGKDNFFKGILIDRPHSDVIRIHVYTKHIMLHNKIIKKQYKKVRLLKL